MYEFDIIKSYKCRKNDRIYDNSETLEVMQMEALLSKARIPQIQYGALDRRCRSLGLNALPVLGLGISRYIAVTPNGKRCDANCQRIFDLTYGKQSTIAETIPIATMDIYVKIRGAYTGESIGETALISLSMDSLDKLRDDQLVRLYDVWQTCQMVLGTLV